MNLFKNIKCTMIILSTLGPNLAMAYDHQRFQSLSPEYQKLKTVTTITTSIAQAESAATNIGGVVINSKTNQKLVLEHDEQNNDHLIFKLISGVSEEVILDLDVESMNLSQLKSKILTTSDPYSYYQDHNIEYFNYYSSWEEYNSGYLSLVNPLVLSVFLIGAAADTVFAPVRLPLVVLDKKQLKNTYERTIEAIDFLSKTENSRMELFLSTRYFDSLLMTLKKGGVFFYKTKLNRVLSGIQKNYRGKAR